MSAPEIVMNVDTTTRCPSCGRDYATPDRMLACSCGGGLVQMQRAALAVLSTVQEGVSALADGILTVGERIATPPGTPSLVDLATRLASQQDALDELILRSLEVDLDELPDLPGLPGSDDGGVLP